MTKKAIQFTRHALFEMQRRRITAKAVEAAIRNPGQVLPSAKGRQIFQQRMPPDGKLLLRVVVSEDATTYHVVTAYKTSQVSKYWRTP